MPAGYCMMFYFEKNVLRFKLFRCSSCFIFSLCMAVCFTSLLYEPHTHWFQLSFISPCIYSLLQFLFSSLQCSCTSSSSLALCFLFVCVVLSLFVALCFSVMLHWFFEGSLVYQFLSFKSLLFVESSHIWCLYMTSPFQQTQHQGPQAKQTQVAPFHHSRLID